MPTRPYFATGDFSGQGLPSDFKLPKPNAFRRFPGKCSATPAPLAPLNFTDESGGLHQKSFAAGINRRKDIELAIAALPLRSVPTIDVKEKPEKQPSDGGYYDGRKITNTTRNKVDLREELWKHESGGINQRFPGKCSATPAPLALPNFTDESGELHQKSSMAGINIRKDTEGAIAAVPLRSVPTINVKGKPEKPLSSDSGDYDGREITNMTRSKGDQREDLWKRESDKLAAVMAEAQEFLTLLDNVYMPNTSKDSGESRDQGIDLPIGEQKLMEMVEQKERDKDMLRDVDKGPFAKRLKVDDGISALIQEEEASGAETMSEDGEDEVNILSHMEWKLEKQCFVKKLERQSSLNFAKECTKATTQSISIVDHIDPIFVDTQSNLPSGRFANCELTENKYKDLQTNSSTDLDERSAISKRGQDKALKMFCNSGEPTTTNSTNRNNGLEYCENHKELINFEIVHRDHSRGRKVMQALRVFKEEYDRLLREHELEKKREGKATKGPHFLAAQHVKEKGIIVSNDKPFGHVPGIEIGDEFSFRVELAIVGLNFQFVAGIDYVTLGGQQYATCVVDSGRYENEAKNHDILIYSGQGGNPNVSPSCATSDQKLEKGNLALMNSMEKGYPVRVVRKRKCLIDSTLFSNNNKRDYVYVYDGLYTVNRFWQVRENQNSKFVFKFELQRLSGKPIMQPMIHAAGEVGKQIQATEVCVSDDISQGKENFKVRVVNGVDGSLPPCFTYITSIVYPHWHQRSELVGCNCIGGCSDSVQCPCVIKNGGEIPFNERGAIMKANTKTAVHECGPSCKCPPSCMNRVSQHGPHFGLEIFKTKSMGWGVRSQNAIKPGNFICEYIGELLGEKEADERTDNDEYLFDIYHGETKEGDFALDAAKCGNIGRFINHSCDPNLFAQKVLFDSEDKRMPHIMFFAGKHIPPRQELRYDYNYKMNRVCDSNGNIKSKDCYCSSRKCSGRLY